jgi:hypothetical protein
MCALMAEWPEKVCQEIGRRPKGQRGRVRRMARANVASITLKASDPYRLEMQCPSNTVR